MSEQGDDKDRLQTFFDQEYEKLDSIERQRAALKDRSNDRGPVLRPSDEFIDKQLGPAKTPAEMNEIAKEKAEARLDAHKANLETQAKREASVERHNTRIENERNNTAERDRVRDNFRQKIADEKKRTKDRDR
ncbi:hypothetical protein [Henriciella sp.]|uniref:hypothetical protein n=1 Tax=Henriciella sp. TaxID=1968823 RepID=UPI002617FA5D|nr:hypothetical protein [Henriciella sp.]